MIIATISTGAVSHLIGALAFVALLAVMARHIGRMEGFLFVFALGATAAWLIGTTGHYAGLWPGVRVVPALEILRGLAWMLLICALLYAHSGRRRLKFRRRYLAPGVVLACLGAVLTGALPILLNRADPLTPNPLAALVLSVAGLLLTETLYRNTAPEDRWRIKFLCLSTGLMFAYDLFLYADAVLFGRVDAMLQLARGVVQAFAVPLLAIAAARSELWNTRISISRQIALGTTTLIASGLYLLVAAAIGFLLREIGPGAVGEARGGVLQVVFFVGAMAVLAVILFSGTYWAHARNFVNMHFYRQRYDWREEWLRFMHTLGAGQSAAPLPERCVKAIADIVESPGGSMWLFDGAHCENTCAWNFEVQALGESDAESFARWLRHVETVVDLTDPEAGAAGSGPSAIPMSLRAAKRAWIVVPLRHWELIGFVVLARPRANRSLNWEDYDLLGVAGRQAAGYLSEQRAVDAIETAREFEIFNRRFAFVIHDVKNLLSQLSILASNFEKHGHRKQFRDDAVSSLGDAAEKMKRLMERIHSLEPPGPPKGRQALEPLVRRVISTAGARVRLAVEGETADLAVLGDRDRLEAVIGHLVQNAVEAEGGDGTISVRVARDGLFAVVNIVDQGSGMDRNFIRQELFKPFQSTKKQGMGIGAYQCREYARELGGNIEAVSQPGQGTTMRVLLPIAE